LHLTNNQKELAQQY